MQPIYEIIIKIAIALPLVFWLYRDSRGRDVYLFLLWTLFPLLVLMIDLARYLPLLVIILGAYLLIRPKGVMQPCPRCNRRIYDMLFICPFCKQNAKHECLHCHEPVPWSADQCPFCRSLAITKDAD
jgi:RNA polymerase subunit RPABC4/transcription elongation factor Spt4